MYSNMTDYLDGSESLEDGVPLASLLRDDPVRLPVAQVNTWMNE